MFDKIELFNMSFALARYSGARQAAIAQNVANADTPGYRPVDLPAFSEIYRGDGRGLNMHASRADHVFGDGARPLGQMLEPTRASSDPNANAVSLEEEMLRAVDVQRAHDRALAIYRSGMTVLRTALSRT